MVNDHWVSAGQYMGLNVSEYGDDLNEITDKRGLFLCNHLGLVDHFCLMTAFHNKKSLPGRVFFKLYVVLHNSTLFLVFMGHFQHLEAYTSWRTLAYTRKFLYQWWSK